MWLTASRRIFEIVADFDFGGVQQRHSDRCHTRRRTVLCISIESVYGLIIWRRLIGVAL